MNTPQPKFYSTKTYSHSVGLSCCFRQWRAEHSHCRFLHGYALQVSFVFESERLDERNWVMDFGGFKEIKEWLQQQFDHKTVVAEDDPLLDHFVALSVLDVVDLNVLPAVGCEAFAKFIYEYLQNWLTTLKSQSIVLEAVKLKYVEVREHESNSAIYGNI